MNSSLEKALEGTWKNKEKFYEDTKHLNIMEILEKIEGKKFIKRCQALKPEPSGKMQCTSPGFKPTG